MVFSPPSAREFQKAAEKVKIVILRPRFRSGPKNLSVKSFSRSMVDAFHQQVHPRGSYPANLIIRTGITHWGSTAPCRTRCPASIVVYLPQVRLAYAESRSREASPSLAIATRAAPPWRISLAVSSPQDSRNSALWLAKCSLRSAAKSGFCGSAQRRVRNESQNDNRGSPGNQFFPGSCERSSAVLQSDPLDQEGPNRHRAARGQQRPEPKARIAVAGYPAAAHEPQRRLPGIQESQRLRRGPPRQPQSQNQVYLLEVGAHRRAVQRQRLRLQGARER